LGVPGGGGRGGESTFPGVARPGVSLRQVDHCSAGSGTLGGLAGDGGLRRMTDCLPQPRSLAAVAVKPIDHLQECCRDFWGEGGCRVQN
jgi:hypothetical protein